MHLQLETQDTLRLNDLLYCHSVDTVSEVLLGKPLGCLKRGKPYFWTKILPRIFYWATILEQFQGSGVPTMIRWMLRHFLRKGVRAKNEEARMRLIREQMNAPHDRRDVMVEVMEKAADMDLALAEIAENFSAIMLAGFHTTQNALCATIYFVLTREEVHRKLVQELQATFPSAEHISGESVQKLPYLNAVINESLRLYPPVPIGPPRTSPGAWVDDVYIPAGVCRVDSLLR
jgi:cytochrome P450